MKNVVERTRMCVAARSDHLADIVFHNYAKNWINDQLIKSILFTR